MNTIERELLHRIITDQVFAEYITQRIDIGDFDDEVANRIYDGIVDLLYRGDRISFEVLLEYFGEDMVVVSQLGKIDKYWYMELEGIPSIEFITPYNYSVPRNMIIKSFESSGLVCPGFRIVAITIGYG